jgi:uncharacterized protein (TIGR00255 family)
MIRSMTGFASLTREYEHATIGVTVRAVNHRFLDLQLRLPQAHAEMEPGMRGLLQRRLTRGRVELAVSVQRHRVSVPVVELNQALVAALTAAIEDVRQRGLVAGHLTPGDLLRVPQAMAISERSPEGAPGEDGQVAAAIESAVKEVLTDLDSMRVLEGGHLRSDLDGRKRTLGGLIEGLAAAAEQGREALEERLRVRVAELMAHVTVDQALLAQEVVRVAQRSDISEEVARFRAHLAHWDTLSDSGESCGRKLDFLIQEMNREINTLGAKADGLHVSEQVIAAKAELERMREQVQNVE